MDDLDRELLDGAGTSRPRVAVVPTASFLDGEETFRDWAARGVAHFSRLQAEVEAVLVRTRRDADDPAFAQAIGEADLVYLSGGRPDYLVDVLAGSAVWRALVSAHARGAAIAGCSAGAMALADRQARVRRRGLPWPIRWREGLGLVPGIAILPQYDAWPEPLTALMALQAPRGSVVVGLDAATRIIGRDGAWQGRGRARVTLWRGGRRERHRAGDVFRI
jgi:cyanophycinase